MSTISIGSPNTVATLGGVLGFGPTEALLTAPDLAGITVDLGAGVISNFVVDGSDGSTVTIDNELSVLSGLTLNTDGADFILDDSAALSAGALSGTTIDIDGGTFQMGAELLSVSLLNHAAVSFGSLGGTDVIASTGTFQAINLLGQTAPLSGFSSNADVIDDQALNYANITGYSITSASAGAQTITVLTSDDSNLTFAVEIATLPDGAALASGSFTSGTGPLNLSADGSGLQLTLCFLGGTMIATPGGETAVESLQPGDLVLTADGHAKPVRWIGISTIAPRFSDPLRTMPVRIPADALGVALPKRDLLLSPDHALLLNGVLVQAGALVDGVSICREPRMPEFFRYYHVELAAHDLILAEGVAAETFVDNCSRMAFDNWQEFMALCGDEPPTGEMAYPRVKARRQLPEALRRTLAIREASLRNKNAA